MQANERLAIYLGVAAREYADPRPPVTPNRSLSARVARSRHRPSIDCPSCRQRMGPQERRRRRLRAPAAQLRPKTGVRAQRRPVPARISKPHVLCRRYAYDSLTRQSTHAVSPVRTRSGRSGAVRCSVQEGRQVDQKRFDQLARTLGLRLPRRHAVSLLSTITAGLGLSRISSPDDAHAKGGRNKKNKHKGQFRCNGTWMNKCVGGQILDDNACVCRCPEGYQFFTQCKQCLPASWCCPGSKLCRGACISEADCCPTSAERTCQIKVKENGKTKTVTICISINSCCPNEEKCPIAPSGCCNTPAGEKCAQFDGCCNTLLGNAVCDGKWCCGADQRCCPGQGCIAKTACCDDSIECPSDPTGCCRANEQCCPGSGCQPLNVQCCASGESNCGGLRCCPPNTTCTVGAYDGQPRAKCCGEPRAGSSMTPCDGECCEHASAIICCPGKGNPCTAPEAGC